MKKTGIILLSSFLFVALIGCEKHKADIEYPAPLCDTTLVLYSKDITPIITDNCFRCHSAKNAPLNGANYNLEDTSTLQNAVLSGELISAIKQDGNLAPPMPADGGKLSECEINKFIAWGHQGAHCDN